jgi:hypothetical protein
LSSVHCKKTTSAPKLDERLPFAPGVAATIVNLTLLFTSMVSVREKEIGAVKRGDLDALPRELGGVERQLERLTSEIILDRWPDSCLRNRRELKTWPLAFSKPTGHNPLLEQSLPPPNYRRSSAIGRGPPTDET